MTDLNAELFEIKRRAEVQNKLIANLFKYPDLKKFLKKEPKFSIGLVFPIVFNVHVSLQLCFNYENNSNYSHKVHVTIYLLVSIIYYIIQLNMQLFWL